MGLFVRGRIWHERANPLSRALIAVYRPVLALALRFRWTVVGMAAVALVLTWIPWARLGSEFMPPLDEGTLLYMPTTTPGISIARARELLRIQDSVLAKIPEVRTVFGKAGRADTPTDPAGLDMFETTITLDPESTWRPGMTQERLVAIMDSAVRMPGIRNAWTMPIRGRIDMLATGIRTPVGVKLFGPDLDVLERLAREVEGHLMMVPGTRSAFAERAQSGFYLDIDIDRGAAARHGLNVGDVQQVIAAAIGGVEVTQTVEGRERYAVRCDIRRSCATRRSGWRRCWCRSGTRSPARAGAARAGPARAGAARPGTAHGWGETEAAGWVGRGGMGQGGNGGGGYGGGSGATAYVPLGQVATIRQTAGPMVVRTEDAQPTAWVYVDVAGSDLGAYVARAQAMIDGMMTLPPGYSIRWSGQYEYMERAKARLLVVVPVTLVIVFLLLYFNFRSVAETALVMLSLPFSLVGGLWLVWGLGYNWSVAVAIGFIALAGVAAETGVVMLLYLDQAWNARRAGGRVPTAAELREAVMEGAVERVRPKMMTVASTVLGLLPILWGTGTGASVMKRIAAPMIGGMISSTVLTLVVIPAVYALWKEREMARLARRAGSPAAVESPAPARVPAEEVATA
jgi:Cu(I)/Ag(I) efflux system membrane protein CusA/SilA